MKLLLPISLIALSIQVHATGVYAPPSSPIPSTRMSPGEAMANGAVIGSDAFQIAVGMQRQNKINTAIDIEITKARASGETGALDAVVTPNDKVFIVPSDKDSLSPGGSTRRQVAEDVTGIPVITVSPVTIITPTPVAPKPVPTPPKSPPKIEPAYKPEPIYRDNFKDGSMSDAGRSARAMLTIFK